jgi:hypothetical protein
MQVRGPEVSYHKQHERYERAMNMARMWLMNDNSARPTSHAAVTRNHYGTANAKLAQAAVKASTKHTHKL